jgi:hypothetical protein
MAFFQNLDALHDNAAPLFPSPVHLSHVLHHLPHPITQATPLIPGTALNGNTPRLSNMLDPWHICYLHHLLH